jgi:ATP-binding cassette subfamily F protein 3
MGSLKKDLRRAEARVEELEQKFEDVEATLADPATYDDADKAIELQKLHHAVQVELEEAMINWEQLAESIAEIEAKFEDDEAD